MKFTLSWLKDHLETQASLEAIVEALTMIGLEVERVEDRAKALAAFTIAKVVSAERHPNADKLQVCMVDTGAGAAIQVVCGAPNARAGMLSVFSPPGAYIPGKNITLGVGSIRGVESRGMLCSAAELELSNDHEGILDLPPDAPVGVSYAAWAGLDDPVIEINLTPNRSDCAGISGIARDLSVAGLGRLRTPPIPPIQGKGPCPVNVTLSFPDGPSLCPAFGLRLVRGVTNGPSPDWLQRRLTAIGLRPINALVDITNYLTFDRGRPLHVFDAAKVTGNLTVRRAEDGETIAALDGKTYRLDSSMCVIADEKGVESIAGIMGGEASGCDETTRDVLIESALWDPLNIARTGRALGISTDARYRFERGVDPAFMLPGLDLATAMVRELCGGEATEAVIAGDPSPPRSALHLPKGEVKRLTGLETDAEETQRILTALGFTVTPKGEAFDVVAPSWRPDVHGSADLVEEVLRIVGVGEIPVTPAPQPAQMPGAILTSLQKRTRLAKRALAARGLMEAVTWSFVSADAAKLFGGGSAFLSLANPIAADLSDMRPSLLPGLAMAAQRNSDRGHGDVALFEVGQVFRGDRPDDQKIAAAGLRMGLAKPGGSGRHWQLANTPPDVFDAKEDMMALLGALGAPISALQIVSGGPSWFHPGRSGTVRLGPQTVIGWFGELHPATLEAIEVARPLAAFELLLDALPQSKPKATRSKGMLNAAPLQPVTRDFAFVVRKDVPAADLLKAIQSADKSLIARVSLFDVYEGAGIEAGFKSLAVEVVLQPGTKTLTDMEIEAISNGIVAEVAKRTGATLRGT